MKIIELFLPLESLEGGVDAISIVDRPAHESNFLTFSADLPDVPEVEYTYIGEKFDTEEQVQLAQTINILGEPVGKLEEEGWEIFRIEPVNPIDFENEKRKFAITSNPTAVSAEDGDREIVRYKYLVAPGQGSPIISTSREFCVEMINANLVFRIEDIIALSEDCANTEFGCYNILTWRGSYNCRHLWYKITYRGGRGPRSGINYPIGQPERPSWAQPSTKVLQQAQDVLGKDFLTKEEFGVLGVIDGQPLFSNREDAEKLAEILGCQGSHEYVVGDFTGYMACETHEFASYDDYPQAASDAACKVLRWIDEHGRDEVAGMTQTGLARANQLCKREPISRDTIARMASFARHRKNAQISPEFEGTPWKDKGYVAWEGWGSNEGIDWAERKLEQLKEEMGLEDACWPGYEAIGTKMVNGKEVPNCVPKDEMGTSISGIVNDGGCCYDIDVSGLPQYVDQVSTGLTVENVFRHGFSYDEEKKEITGAAIIPNKMIIRRNPITEELYYVFFSEETTKILSERFMRNKYQDQTNLNHTDTPAKNTYVSESWLISDPQKDKTASMGLDYPKGTWVITMKVGDQDLWRSIKNGEYNGFSIEGYFNERVLFD